MSVQLFTTRCALCKLPLGSGQYCAVCAQALKMVEKLTSPKEQAQTHHIGHTCGECAWLGDTGDQYPAGECRRVECAASTWPETPKKWAACPAFVPKEVKP